MDSVEAYTVGRDDFGAGADIVTHISVTYLSKIVPVLRLQHVEIAKGGFRHGNITLYLVFFCSLYQQ